MYRGDIDAYGTYEAEIKNPTAPDEYVPVIVEIGFVCHGTGHSGYFDPISGMGEGPEAPDLEAVEFRLVWDNNTHDYVPYDKAERIIPQFAKVVESCYEDAVNELREYGY